MVYLAITLLLIGIACLFIEVFVPGFGVFGISGIISIIVSSIITVIFIPFGIIIVVSEIIIIALLMIAILNYIKRHQLHGKIILDESLNYEKNEMGDLDYFVGKEGITKTPLKPFGNVDFNGVTIEAYSDGEYIQSHEKVKVINVHENKIYVKKLNSN